jgi:molybdopterin synthase catalytic subunit
MIVVRLKILFFGMVKDMVGRSSDSLEMPEGASLGQVFEHYAAASPSLREFAASVVLARNQSFAPRTETVQDGDEIAFLPPVSGGSGPYSHVIEDPAGHFFAITREPIDGTALARRLLQGKDGAFVNFEGVVRDNTKGRATRYLDYECYEAMAIKVMAELGREIAGKHDISRIGIVHRLGRMEIGETSVAVVVTSPHRRAAFDAALEGIDRLKKIVPIWKKEYFADGEVWVEGAWDDSIVQR